MVRTGAKLNGVVFDLAGVLVGSALSQRARWDYVARVVGLDTEQLVERFGPDGYRPVRLRQRTHEEWWKEQMDVLGVAGEYRRSLLHDQLFNRLAPDPYLLDIIADLQRSGARLALLSNGGGVSDWLIERYPFLASFDALLLSGEIGAAKPSREAFAIVERALALPPSSLLLVDDSPTNVAAARRFGWQAHLFEDARTLEVEVAAWGLMEAT